MARKLTKEQVLNQTIEDLCDDADDNGLRLDRESIDKLYFERSISPDEAIAIEKALSNQGISITEGSAPDIQEPTLKKEKDTAVFPTALDHLLYSASQIPLLTSDQEAALGEKIQRGISISTRCSEELNDIEQRIVEKAEQAKSILIESNIRLVAKFAFMPKFRNRLDIEDLVQLGLIGLMTAAKKFDPIHGCKFSTYASWWIMQGMYRGIANDADTIRLPVHMHDKVKKYRSTKYKLGLNGDIGDRNAITEISESLGWKRSFTAKIALLSEMRTVPFDMKIVDDGDFTLADTIPCNRPNPEDLCLKRDKKDNISRYIEDLKDPRQKEIIKKRFGFDCQEETLEEIGAQYEVTRERIRQIESKVLKKLKLRMNSSLINPKKQSG